MATNRILKRELTELEGIDTGYFTFSPFSIRELKELEDKKFAKNATDKLIKILSPKIKEVSINGEVVKDLQDLDIDVLMYIIEEMSGNKKK